MSTQQRASQRSAEEADEANFSNGSDLDDQGNDSTYEPGSEDEVIDGKSHCEPNRPNHEIHHKMIVPTQRRKRAVTEAEKQERRDEKIKRRKTELCADLKKKDDKLRELRNQLEECKSRLRESQHKNEDTEKRLKNSEKRRNQMFDQVFKKVEGSRDFFESDEQVTQTFTRVFESVNAWSKKYAARREDTSKDHFATVGQYLCRKDSCSEFASDKMKRAMMTGLIHPFVITAAVINQLLVLEIFNNPFGFLIQRINGEQEVKIIEWFMSVARKKGSEVEKRGAQVFFMKLLSLAPGEVVEKSAETHFEAMAKLKKEHSLARCRKLLTVINVLLKQVTEQAKTIRERSLANIVGEAMNLSCRLASQRSSVQLKFLSQLEHERYKVNHDRFECHRACKLDDIAPSKSTVYMKRLDMVIQPLILRTGDAQGNMTSKAAPRILLKAVIWMVESENPLKEGNKATTLTRQKMKQSDI